MSRSGKNNKPWNWYHVAAAALLSVRRKYFGVSNKQICALQSKFPACSGEFNTVNLFDVDIAKTSLSIFLKDKDRLKLK